MKQEKPDIIDAEWRPVRPPMKKGEVLNYLFLAFMFLGGAGVCFWSSGMLQWWELKRFGEEAPAFVVALDFRTSTLQDFSSSIDLLTVTFRDGQGRYQEVTIADNGRFAVDHRVNPHNPVPSLPKPATVVYSRRDPNVAELRDYRNHSWWMFGFSILVATIFPVVYFLGRRETRLNERLRRF